MRKVALTLVILTVITLLAAVVVVVDARGENLPYYADLTFIDMADLDRQCDSVLAVCDTIWYLSQEFADSLWEHYRVDISRRHNITCRHFAGREVWEMPDSMEAELLPYPQGSRWEVYPGKARLWYEERRK